MWVCANTGKATSTESHPIQITIPKQKGVPVHWVVNKKTGENLYTTAVAEVNKLCNVKKTWTNKGIIWYAPTSGQVVYRLVNLKTGDHHFTKSRVESDTLVKRGTWRKDFGGKPVFYSGGPKKIWRLYSSSRWKAGKAGTHRFATSAASAKALTQKGWRNEGVLLYAVKVK